MVNHSVLLLSVCLTQNITQREKFFHPSPRKGTIFSSSCLSPLSRLGMEPSFAAQLAMPVLSGPCPSSSAERSALYSSCPHKMVRILCQKHVSKTFSIFPIASQPLFHYNRGDAPFAGEGQYRLGKLERIWTGLPPLVNGCNIILYKHLKRGEC